MYDIIRENTIFQITSRDVPNGEAYPTEMKIECGGCGNWDSPDSVS
ncbi:6797_t:CDS:2 [Scutellospora calospora]|uniref:6797_t:CDS:1 n=1 Tax=Scutellospora calospora TaxID=85575 RepID=A0ACA9K2K8_9GLOM|nr:6797_t:CDS:2 [Scutellospora calospora]